MRLTIRYDIVHIWKFVKTILLNNFFLNTVGGECLKGNVVHRFVVNA